MNHSIEKVIICDKCMSEFLVESVKIDKCSVEIDGKMFLLNYFTCPKCNSIYRVLLVEEQKFNELLEDVMIIKNRIRKCKGNGNVRLHKQLQNMSVKKKNRICRYVESVNSKYSGAFTFKSSENNKKEIIYLP